MFRGSVRTALDVIQRVMVQLEFGNEHGFRKRYERGIRPLPNQPKSISESLGLFRTDQPEPRLSDGKIPLVFPRG
jgi:hypothetical protein